MWPLVSEIVIKRGSLMHNLLGNGSGKPRTLTVALGLTKVTVIER